MLDISLNQNTLRLHWSEQHARFVCSKSISFTVHLSENHAAARWFYGHYLQNSSENYKTHDPNMDFTIFTFSTINAIRIQIWE